MDYTSFRETIKYSSVVYRLKNSIRDSVIRLRILNGKESVIILFLDSELLYLGEVNARAALGEKHYLSKMIGHTLLVDNEEQGEIMDLFFSKGIKFTMEELNILNSSNGLVTLGMVMLSRDRCKSMQTLYSSSRVPIAHRVLHVESILEMVVSIVSSGYVTCDLTLPMLSIRSRDNTVILDYCCYFIQSALLTENKNDLSLVRRMLLPKSTFYGGPPDSKDILERQYIFDANTCRQAALRHFDTLFHRIGRMLYSGLLGDRKGITVRNQCTNLTDLKLNLDSSTMKKIPLLFVSMGFRVIQNREDSSEEDKLTPDMAPSAEDHPEVL